MTKQIFASVEIDVYDGLNLTGKKIGHIKQGRPLPPEADPILEVAEIHPDGSETVKIKKRADSYVGNMLKLLRAHFETGSPTTQTLTDNIGVSRNLSGTSNNDFLANAGSGDAAFGVVVGTGTATVLVTDTKLGAQISEGTGAAKTITNVVNSGGFMKVTAASHGFAPSQTVVIASVTGTGNITDTNGTHTITSIPDGNSFIIDVAYTSGTYSAGGTATVAAQLNHQAVQFDTPTVAGSTCSFVIKRRFINNSAATVTITEQGIYAKGDTFIFLIARELFGGGFAVTAGSTCEVRWTIPITLGASWLANLDKGFCQFMGQTTTWVDVGSNSITPCQAGVGNGFHLNAGIGITTFGIITGTGTTASVITDINLAAVVGHGTGSGQLSYQAMQFDTPVTVSTTITSGAKRTVNNSSGAGITIHECGIYVQSYNAGTNPTVLIARDVLGTPQLVPNGGSAQVKYNYGITS